MVGRLSDRQRNFLADKIMDTANYAVAGLVFGQLLTTVSRLLELVFGIVFYLWILSLTLSLKRR